MTFRKRCSPLDKVSALVYHSTSKGQNTVDNKKLGIRGEAYARHYLESKGYTILAQNWTCQYGEIDLVTQHHDTIVFVEVRTRRASTQAALESITPTKREHMINSAHAYIHDHNLPEDATWQIDVIAVALQKDNATLEHVENALDW
jgi:putative endonuclease